MLSFLSVSKMNKEMYRKHMEEVNFDSRSCEYNYANLIAWQNVYNSMFAKTPDTLYIKMYFDGVKKHLCPITKGENLEKAVSELVQWTKSIGESKIELAYIPKTAVETIRKVLPHCIISSDRGSFDYIYPVSALSTFSGKALHGKKNHKNKFLSLYGNSYEYRKITPDNVDLCRKFNEKWYEINKEYEDFDFLSEKKATEIFLDNFQSLGLVGGMLFVENQLCAYTIASSNLDNSDTINIHIEKGLYDIPGVYPMICSEFLLHEGEKYTFVNREDDMNNEGLRKSKMSYNPIFFEEKYFISANLV